LLLVPWVTLLLLPLQASSHSAWKTSPPAGRGMPLCSAANMLCTLVFGIPNAAGIPVSVI
jgi:hypothetical protein